MQHEIEHLLHFERGFLYTVKGLLTSPGQSVRDYLLENRSRLVKPIVFIIVTSLLYSIASHFFHVEDEYVQYTEAKRTTTGAIFKWIQEHYGYSNIIMGLFIALWTKILFRKYKYNIFEILILLCFAMGIAMLLIALFAVAQGVTHINLMQVGGIVAVLYCTWAIGEFFDKNKVLSYIKALFAYLLGMISFALSAIALGSMIDLIAGH